MKFSITAMLYIPAEESNIPEGTSVIALVGVKDGVYAVDFGRKTANFMERKNFREAVEFLSEFVNFKSVYHTPDFTQRNLKSKEGMKGVRYYPCGSVTVFDTAVTKRDKKLLMEYYDTTRGEIPAHNHLPDKCIEVYLSAEAPYKGEFCDFGETHKPFCEKTVAVKMYV